MKLVYKYTSDIIDINYFELISKTVLNNFKEIHNYNLVCANIITEGKTICKVIFLKDDDSILIDLIDYNYIGEAPQTFYTISCNRCGRTYINSKEEYSYNDYLGCYCYEPDVDRNCNETECDDIINYLFKPNLNITIEYCAYIY